MKKLTSAVNAMQKDLDRVTQMIYHNTSAFRGIGYTTFNEELEETTHPNVHKQLMELEKRIKKLEEL